MSRGFEKSSYGSCVEPIDPGQSLEKMKIQLYNCITARDIEDKLLYKRNQKLFMSFYNNFEGKMESYGDVDLIVDKGQNSNLLWISMDIINGESDYQEILYYDKDTKKFSIKTSRSREDGVIVFARNERVAEFLSDINIAILKCKIYISQIG